MSFAPGERDGAKVLVEVFQWRQRTTSRITPVRLGYGGARWRWPWPAGRQLGDVEADLALALMAVAILIMLIS